MTGLGIWMSDLDGPEPAGMKSTEKEEEKASL
jgi:hypothetical protein